MKTFKIVELVDKYGESEAKGMIVEELL